MHDLHASQRHAFDLAGQEVAIEPLLPSDIPGMVELIRRTAIPAQVARSIYVAHGVEAYLAILAQDTDLQSHEQLWGLKDPEHRLLAVGHSRTLADSSHFGWLAVEPRVQCMKVVSRMFGYWDGLARAQGKKVQTLDVAEVNAQAERLYERLGFQVEYTTYEFRHRGTRDPEAAERLVLLNWPLALASAGTYGFGRFQVELDGAVLDVDLTPAAFRTSSADPRVLGLAARLDPARAFLLRTRVRELGPDWELTGSVDRMWKDPWAEEA